MEVVDCRSLLVFILYLQIIVAMNSNGSADPFEEFQRLSSTLTQEDYKMIQGILEEEPSYSYSSNILTNSNEAPRFTALASSNQPNSDPCTENKFVDAFKKRGEWKELKSLTELERDGTCRKIAIKRKEFPGKPDSCVGGFSMSNGRSHKRKLESKYSQRVFFYLERNFLKCDCFYGGNIDTFHLSHYYENRYFVFNGITRFAFILISIMSTEPEDE